MIFVCGVVPSIRSFSLTRFKITDIQFSGISLPAYRGAILFLPLPRMVHLRRYRNGCRCLGVGQRHCIFECGCLADGGMGISANANFPSMTLAVVPLGPRLQIPLDVCHYHLRSSRYFDDCTIAKGVRRPNHIRIMLCSRTWLPRMTERTRSFGNATTAVKYGPQTPNTLQKLLSPSGSARPASTVLTRPLLSRCWSI